MSDVIKDIVLKLGQLSDTEREDALSAITNHFCLGCGAAGDWSEKTCDCLPRALRARSSGSINSTSVSQVA